MDVFPWNYVNRSSSESPWEVAMDAAKNFLDATEERADLNQHLWRVVKKKIKPGQRFAQKNVCFSKWKWVWVANANLWKFFFLCFWNYQFETQVEFASLLKNLEEQETNNYEVCIMKQVVPSHFSPHFSHRRRYWFSPATVSTFVAEICDKGGSAALVSSPSVYFSLPEALFGADGWWIRGILEEHTSRNLNLDNKNHGRL